VGGQSCSAECTNLGSLECLSSSGGPRMTHHTCSRELFKRQLWIRWKGDSRLSGLLAISRWAGRLRLPGLRRGGKGPGICQLGKNHAILTIALPRKAFRSRMGHRQARLASVLHLQWLSLVFLLIQTLLGSLRCCFGTFLRNPNRVQWTMHQRENTSYWARTKRQWV